MTAKPASPLGQAFDVAFRTYLMRPTWYRELYTTYLAVEPKFLPECEAIDWPSAPTGRLDAALKRGTLRFGYADGAPYVYRAGNGELEGLDWEMGNAVTAILRSRYLDYAPGKGLRPAWIKVAPQTGGDPEVLKFNALYDALKAGTIDIALSGQADISAASTSPAASREVYWSCPTALLFTSILYSGRGNLHEQVKPLVGADRDAFIRAIRTWTTPAIFSCVVNDGPSKTNTESLVKDIGASAQLLYADVPAIRAAIADQTIHFSIGDCIAYSTMALTPGFKGLNLNIAAAVDPRGTAQAVSAFMLADG